MDRGPCGCTERPSARGFPDHELTLVDRQGTTVAEIFTTDRTSAQPLLARAKQFCSESVRMSEERFLLNCLKDAMSKKLKRNLQAPKETAMRSPWGTPNHKAQMRHYSLGCDIRPPGGIGRLPTIPKLQNEAGCDVISDV
jgi:hypothetical protein